MTNIITSVCVDTSLEDGLIEYPMMSGKTQSARRDTYWKMAAVFCCSSLRCNPGHSHHLFTNDTAPVLIDGFDLRSYLVDQGVKIQIVPFKDFLPPPNASKRFKNAFYKFEALKACINSDQDQDNNIVLVDSDCLWVQPDQEFHSKIHNDAILIYDVYQREDPFQSTPHNLSMAEMGSLYAQVDPVYPNPHPIWYGGEFLAGKKDLLKIIVDDFEDVFNQLGARFKNEKFVFKNGLSIFDNDEFVSSYVYNKKNINLFDSRQFIKRMWATDYLNNIVEDDLNTTIWHLPAEKDRGLKLLFNQVILTDSPFWLTPIEDFNKYLGKYVGIPRREFDVPLSTKTRLKNYLNRALSWFS